MFWDNFGRRNRQGSTDTKSEGEQFVSAHLTGRKMSEEEKSCGADLAGKILSDAITLGSNKATEYSPEIQDLQLLAAKIALIVYGAESPNIERYEEEIMYYKVFTPVHSVVAKYEQFKREHSNPTGHGS